MKLKAFPLICSLMVIALFQGCNLSSRIKKADKVYSQGEYFKACDLYKKIYNQVPSTQKTLRGRIAFQMGECYRFLGNTNALQNYLYAINYKYSDSVVFLRYAQMLQRNGKYADAIRNFGLYHRNDSLAKLASNGVAACTGVADWRKQPSRYQVKKADLFNMNSSDNFSPAFQGSNADVVLFTSSRTLKKQASVKQNSVTGLLSNKMFSIRKDAAGKWEKPVALSDEINKSDADQGVCAFGGDGKVMYFTRARQMSDSELGTEIYSSNRAGGTWSVPQKIKVFNDSTISVAHPAMSPDGLTLYFVSDAPRGQGGKDIWKATLENGECKYIENLGSEINTPGDEMFPTVRADGTLYFSSNGHPGYGGLDIFKAQQQKTGEWVVENMGEPVNSTVDDFGMAFAGDTESGYFSSNRTNAKGLVSIWSFVLPELAYVIEGKVTDEKGVALPDAFVRLVSSTGSNIRTQTKKDGTYRIRIDKDMDCVVMASSRGYLNQMNRLSTQGLTDSKTFSQDFKLSSISKPIQIDNIFYEFGKWDLTPSSTAGLETLIKILKDNPNITIELSANTDMVGNNDANKILSAKRAKSVVDYLINAGIAADRLTAVGNGEEKPIVVDAKQARTYRFMKENDVLNEEYVSKLTPEQQEVANQLNRRTEFRVLKTTYKLY